MRLCTVQLDDGTTRAGRVQGDRVVMLSAADLGDLFASGSRWHELAAADGEDTALVDVCLVSPVRQPSKVMCVGLNYVRHAAEAGHEVPSFPTLFAKYADALTGPFDDLVLPAASECVDWEAELVIVIGQTIRDGSDAEAAAAIAGFTVGNDVSMRDWQLRTPQWLQGKTWERSSPVGPVVVTPDELGGPRPDLAISCAVDDEVVQAARTSEMYFDPVHLVRYASTIVTLRPGDLIFSGTPDGVGFVQQPPRYLRPGQVMTTEIESIGAMSNRVLAVSGVSETSPSAVTAS